MNHLSASAQIFVSKKYTISIDTYKPSYTFIPCPMTTVINRDIIILQTILPKLIESPGWTKQDIIGIIKARQKLLQNNAT